MSVRRPSCTINGVPVEEAEILVHRYQSASAFTAMLSMTKIEKLGGSISDWIDNAPQVSIKGSNDGNGSREIISGKCDAVEANWFSRTIHIEGRDATANLLDTNIDPVKDQFKNKSAEDIVREIAGRAGLSIETGGGGGGGGGSKAGRPHVNDEYDYITGHQSLFNIIQSLAEREGKTFWVSGSKLFWQDLASGGGQGGSISIHYRKPGPGSPQGNFTGLKTTRNFMAEKAKADVSSYQTRKKETVGDGSSDSGGSGGESGGGGDSGGDSGSGSGSDGAKMKLQVHNMTQEQAQNAGKAITAAAQQHALRLVYEGPGDVNADPRMTVSLSGTGTVFDDSYDCDSIRHVFDGDGSYYGMTVDARTKGSGGEGG